jgi:hypothetical protein
MNGCSLDYKTEGVLIINPISLLESFCHQPSFISVDAAICLSLDFVNPFAIYDISTRLPRDQVPRTVLLKCIILFVHGILPSLIKQGLMDTVWLFCIHEKPISYCSISVDLGFVNPTLKPCGGTSRHMRWRRHKRSRGGGILQQIRKTQPTRLASLTR